MYARGPLTRITAPVRFGSWPPTTEDSSGGARRSRPSTSARRARAPPRHGDRVLGRGRHRQDAAAGRARRARRRAGTWSVRPRVGARARAAVRRLGGRARRARRVPRRRPARAARRRPAAGAGGGAADGRAASRPACRTSATARTARSARCWRRSRSARRWCVALDDLHWADDASLELVAHLLRRPPRGRVALALAFRPAPVRPLLATALATAERDGSVIEHTLGALRSPTPRRCSAPTSRRRSAARSTRRAAATRSSCSSSRASTPRGASSRPSRPAAACRARSRGRWSRRSRRSARTARRLAQGAAVAGDPVDLDLAMAAAALDEEAALEALDELLAGALLTSTDVPRRYRFRHPLVRLAIYDSAAEGWRIAAHGRAAAALAERGGSLAARAHHLERCARPGDAEALEVLVEAGRHAAARAPATAADRFAAALRLLPETRRPCRGGSSCSSGWRRRSPRPGGWRRRWRRSATGWRWSGRSSRRCARGSWRAARCARTCSAATPPRTRGCWARWTRSARRAPSPPPTSRSSSPPTRSTTATSPARSWAQRARRPRRRSAMPRFIAVATALECFGAIGLGEIDDGAAAARGRRRAARRARRRRARGRLDTAYYLGFAEFFCERYDDAIRHFRRGIAVSRASGQGQFVI